MAEEVHTRFSYPEYECGADHIWNETLHECDLPEGHVTRHMCGYCGLYFDDRNGAVP